MEIRSTAEVRGPLSPEIGLVVSVIAAAPVNGVFWITALANGAHMEGSEHYAIQDPENESDAIDGDCTDTATNVELAQYLREALPPSFDVLLEDRGESNEHIHVERDPDQDQPPARA